LGFKPVERACKSLCALLVAAAALSGLADAAGVRGPGQLTLNGVVFTIPERFVKLPGEARANSVLLYDQQYKNGMVVVVPAAPFDEAELLKNLMQDSQKAFFPKETLPYQWKSTDLLRKVSKFEVKDALEKGLNRNHLLLFEYRHVVFNQRDVFVATIFEARRGKPAQEMFKAEAVAASMTTCRAAVEVIYSVTGEKIDPDRPPCELGANVP
jgi:hypothetical protein